MFKLFSALCALTAFRWVLKQELVDLWSTHVQNRQKAYYGRLCSDAKLPEPLQTSTQTKINKYIEHLANAGTADPDLEQQVSRIFQVNWSAWHRCQFEHHRTVHYALPRLCQVLNPALLNYIQQSLIKDQKLYFALHQVNHDRWLFDLLIFLLRQDLHLSCVFFDGQTDHSKLRESMIINSSPMALSVITNFGWQQGQLPEKIGLLVNSIKQQTQSLLSGIPQPMVFLGSGYQACALELPIYVLKQTDFNLDRIFADPALRAKLYAWLQTYFVDPTQREGFEDIEKNIIDLQMMLSEAKLPWGYELKNYFSKKSPQKDSVDLVDVQLDSPQKTNFTRDELINLDLPIDFAYFGDYYLEQAQSWQQSLANLNSNSAECHVYSQRLSTLLRCRWLEKEHANHNRNPQTLLSCCQTSNFMSNPMHQVMDHLQVGALKKKWPNFLFVGPPGVGKTYFAQQISKTLNRKAVVINCAGMANVYQLWGWPASFQGATIGTILAHLLDHRQLPVLILDEVDKMAEENLHHLTNSLLRLLDVEQKKQVWDNFLGISFDLRNLPIVLTANHAEKLPEPLRQRCQIVPFSGYSSAEKIDLVEQVFLPQLNQGLDAHLHWNPSRLEIKNIVNLFLDDPGVRNLQNFVEQQQAKHVADLLCWQHIEKA